jgi:peptidoglycan hydrolase-like protein with peptidoglycan-binding domain
MEMLKTIPVSAETFKEIDWVTDQINMELLKFKIGVENKKNNLFITDKNEFDVNLAKEYLSSIQEKSRKELWSQNSSAWIMAVQILLESLWYHIGKIDWILWPQTKEGVKIFQAQVGISTDWLPGQETIKQLIKNTENKKQNEDKKPRPNEKIDPIPSRSAQITTQRPTIKLIERSEEEKIQEIFIWPENEKASKYINYIIHRNNFNEKTKTNIKKYGPTVIHEAKKYPETKNIIPKIFAQVQKESWRNPQALNDKGEYSIWLFQINKASWHTGHINNKYYNINTIKWNIQYGIAYLSKCIKKEWWNIARGFDRYNWTGNFSVSLAKRYSHTIINDNLFAVNNQSEYNPS